jgi:hypothetical protein
MQWGETETSPSLGAISLKKILVLGRDMPALAASVVLSAVKIVPSAICDKV